MIGRPHTCCACGRSLVRKPGETLALYRTRQVCDGACMRRTKLTKAEAGRLGWTPEARRMRRGTRSWEP